MTPINSYSDRLARLEEWRRMQVRDYEAMQQTMRDLRVEMLKNWGGDRIAFDASLDKLEERIVAAELWQSNRDGRTWTLITGFSVLQILVGVVIHYMFR